MISERSSLYSLEPIGIGTPFVESLSSYICRLAKAHNVSVSFFMQKKLFPELTSCPSILNGHKGRVFDGFQVNGLGITTLDFVNTVEKLTLRNDIHNLTLLNFTAFFSINAKKLIVRKKRWCPSCFMDYHKAGEVFYEPLLWHLEEYQNCIKHKCKLQSKCWKCKKEVKAFFLKITTIGYCPFCKVFLGETDVLDCSSIEEKEYFTIQFFCEILMLNATAHSYPTRYSIEQFIKKLYESNIFRPYRSSSEIMNFSECAFKSWITGVSLPNPFFWSILKKIAKSPSINQMILEKDIFNRLIANLEYHLNSKNHKRKVSHSNRGHNSKETIHKKLLNYLEKENFTFGIIHLCKLEGFSLTTARKYFPELCNLIVEKHRDYKNAQKDEIRKKILIIAEDEESGQLSVKDVSKRLEISQSFIKSNFPDLNKIIASKHKTFKKESKIQRITDLKQAIQEGILKLHHIGIYPTEDKILSYLPTDQKCVFFANPELREF